MAYSSRAIDMLSSPSFQDSEAASQQLLAEASSPVRRPSAAPAAPSSSAVIGASLLNHARTLTKPPVLAPLVPKEKTGKLPRLGSSKPAQLKPGQLKATPLPKPGKFEKPGKLARASLSSLVSEGPLRKVRGDKMYDIDQDSHKKRPHSLPAQVEEFAREVVGEREEDIVPETTQAQPGGEKLAGASKDSSIPTADKAPISVESVESPIVLPAAPPQEEPTARPKKQRGRPRKSGESTAAVSSGRATTVQAINAATVNSQSQEEAEVAHMPSSPPERPREEVAKMQRGRPRNIGESTSSALSPDIEEAAAQGQTEPLDPIPKLKRKVRVEEQQMNTENDESGGQLLPAKKLKRLNGPAMISPDAIVFDEDSIASEPTARGDASHEADGQPQNSIPIRSTRSRTTRAEAEVANAQEHSATAIINAAAGSKKKSRSCHARKTRSTNSGSVPEPTKPKVSASGRGSERGADTQDGHVDEIDEAATGEVSTEPAVADNEDVEEQEHRPEHASDQVAVSTGVEQPTEGDVSRTVELDRVFNFTDHEERSGNCATKVGRAIRRLCHRSRVLLSRSGGDRSLKDIETCKDELIHFLRSISVKIQDDRRSVFKRDAFAYLFRDLTLVLEAMHDKLQEKYGDITESLESMQIVHPYIRELLRFKDAMDGWKVVVQQLTKGERLIKGVESDLIAPLRVLEKEFAKHHRQLQKAETHRRTVAEAQRRREEEESDAFRREEVLRSARERRNRWQSLHIDRMQCEPDALRRRRLRFVEPVPAAETDANGQPFERIPFFGERSAPPPQWTAASSGREWTDEQETALLDALQSSASLERIFKLHCRPGGALRDFSVSDIVTKMAWVRSGWAQLSHQHGWEVPTWVKNIPVLP